MFSNFVNNAAGLRDYTQYVNPSAFSDINEKLDDWETRKDPSRPVHSQFARNAVLLYELVKEEVDYRDTGQTVEDPRTIYRRQYGDCEDQSVLLASMACAAKHVNYIRFTYVEDHVFLQLGKPTRQDELDKWTVKELAKAYTEFCRKEDVDLYTELETRNGWTIAWLVADPTSDYASFGDVRRLQKSGDVEVRGGDWRWKTLRGHKELPARLSKYNG